MIMVRSIFSYIYILTNSFSIQQYPKNLTPSLQRAAFSENTNIRAVYYQSGTQLYPKSHLSHLCYSTAAQPELSM